jgi:hypothetical protein
MGDESQIDADVKTEPNPRIAEYMRIIGVDGALLQSVPPYSQTADAAQFELREVLKQQHDVFKRRFGRGQAPKPDDYWMHRAKFNGELLQDLTDYELAWRSDPPCPYGPPDWFALHPRLGSAIMTTLGLGIARDEHFDIVTPSSELHETLLATEVPDVFSTLLAEDKGDAASPRSAPQVRRDLGQMVITLSGLNFEALRPEAIPKLQASPHFQKFQRLLRSHARNIDQNADPRDYRPQLEAEAEEIVGAWQDTRSSLSADLRDALFEQGAVMSAETLKGLWQGVDVTELCVTGGLAVVLLARRAMEQRSKRSTADPYQYLTQVVRAENEALRIAFPLGLER